MVLFGCAFDMDRVLTLYPGETSTTSSEAESSTSHSSKLVTETFTSTSDGSVVIVTATTFVNADPEQTTGPTSTRAQGTLQTNAALPNNGRGRVLEAMVGAALFGGALMV
jgi:hypothetical protein